MSFFRKLPISIYLVNLNIFFVQESKCSLNAVTNSEHISDQWDCSLHLPLWVSATEKAAIENHLEEWTEQLESCGADINSLASLLKKPLRTLWVSQKTLIWLNEVPEYDSWHFTPIILLSASATDGTIPQRTMSEFSWHYIPGAGDDEESWARGLSPFLFWKHKFDLIDSGPDSCNQKVSDIVERERVYRSQRGEVCPQVIVKPQKSSKSSFSDEDIHTNCQLELPYNSMDIKSSDNKCSIFWIGSTNVAVGKSCESK